MKNAVKLTILILTMSAVNAPAASAAEGARPQKGAENLVRHPSIEGPVGARGLPDGWQGAHCNPDRGYKFLVVDGGRTGDKSLVIQGKGNFGVVSTNKVLIDRNMRYRARGWVKIEGDARAAADVKFHYFDANRRYLGQTRIPFVSPLAKNWTLVEVTDRASDFPTARWIQVAVALAGNGKARFDDLELTAHRRDKVPVDFDLSPELKVLSQLGNWQSTVIVHKAKWNPKETRGTITSSVVPVLGGCFTLQRADKSDGGTFFNLTTYDAQRKCYRMWYFDSQGNAGESTGKWDARTKTSTWLSDKGNGVTSVLKAQYLDDNTRKFSFVVKDAAGEIGAHIEGKSTRVKQLPKRKNIPTSRPANRSAEQKVLDAFLGDWEGMATEFVAWDPNETRKTDTSSCVRILGGHFTRNSSKVSDGSTNLTLATYDAQRKCYRMWHFNSQGFAIVSQGKWDAKTRTLTMLAEQVRGMTITGKFRLVDADTEEQNWIIKDPDGKTIFQGKKKNTRAGKAVKNKAAGGGNDLLDHMQTEAYWKIKGVTVTAETMQAELTPLTAGQIKGLVGDLTGDDKAKGAAAATKLSSMGAAVLPQLEKAAAAAQGKPEKAAAIQRLIGRVLASGQGGAVRRLMAIRAIGELKARPALGVLKGLLKSKTLFEADYAAAAIAAIEGKAYKRPGPSAKLLAADVLRLPAGCGIAGQFRMTPGAPMNVDKLFKDMGQLSGGMKSEELTAQVTQMLVGAADMVGNIRFDSVTLGVANTVGGRTGFGVFIVRGKYDAKAISALFGAQRGAKSETINGIEVLGPGGSPALIMPDNDTLILCLGPSRAAMPLGEVTAGIKTGLGGFKGDSELGKLIATVDKSGPLWAAATITEAYAKEGGPMFAAFKAITLKSKSVKGGQVITVTGKGSDAKAVAAAVKVFEGHIAEGKTELGREVQRGGPRSGMSKPMLAFLKSMKAKADGASATVTAAMTGSPLMTIAPLFIFGTTVRDEPVKRVEPVPEAKRARPRAGAAE